MYIFKFRKRKSILKNHYYRFITDVLSSIKLNKFLLTRDAFEEEQDEHFYYHAYYTIS